MLLYFYYFEVTAYFHDLLIFHFVFSRSRIVITKTKCNKHPKKPGEYSSQNVVNIKSTKMRLTVRIN